MGSLTKIMLIHVCKKEKEHFGGRWGGVYIVRNTHVHPNRSNDYSYIVCERERGRERDV